MTAAEIDQEIDNVAMRMAGIGREAWLRTLDKERGISPVQYARDIIYPALALRKLAAQRVQVTEKDMRESFEAQYGDKLRCRMIMVDKLATAKEIWEELRKNPGGFEKLAQERSMDTGQPLARRPARRADHPPRLSPERLRRRLRPARRRRSEGQGPHAQTQERRLHRPDPGGRGDLGPDPP